MWEFVSFNQRRIFELDNPFDIVFPSFTRINNRIIIDFFNDWFDIISRHQFRLDFIFQIFNNDFIIIPTNIMLFLELDIGFKILRNQIIISENVKSSFVVAELNGIVKNIELRLLFVNQIMFGLLFVQQINQHFKMVPFSSPHNSSMSTIDL